MTVKKAFMVIVFMAAILSGTSLREFTSHLYLLFLLFSYCDEQTKDEVSVGYSTGKWKFI